MSAPDRDAWFEFQNEDLEAARLLTVDADRLYAAGAAGDAALCWLDGQSIAGEVDAGSPGQLSVPVLKLHSSRQHWKHAENYPVQLLGEARRGLVAGALRDAVPVKLVFYSSFYPAAQPVAMAGLLRIGAMLAGANHARNDEWYEFQEGDLFDARAMTPDADRLYAAGTNGDNALIQLAMQADAATFGKTFHIPIIDVGPKRRYRAEIADFDFMEKARYGLPVDVARNSLAVEVVFTSDARPDAPPVSMAGIVYIGAMLKGGAQ